MRLKEKAKLKDDIIGFCIKKEHCKISDISKDLSIEYDIAYSLIQDLIDQELLTLNAKFASIDSYTKNDMEVVINPKGRYFLNHEGGSIMVHKRYRQQQSWIIAKISAATANAVAIVFISIWGITKANDTKQFEKKLNTLDSIIINQNLEIDNLKNVILLIENDSLR